MQNSPSWTLQLLGLVLAFSACAAAAQNYPARQVRIVVPSAPGGGTDVAARVLAQKLTERVGQSFIVDNRPGASGRPRAVNRAPACGMRTSASRDARRWI